MPSAARALEHVEIQLAGARVIPLWEGALWWPGERVLVVSDLHLEKGSSYAARGQMLPPYDTDATLSMVESLCTSLTPRLVISLGDSFHDRTAEVRLPDSATSRIQALTEAHDWMWIEGNHDPDPPRHLGGHAAKVLTIGPLTFRHEPEGQRGEVAGHLHPAAKVRARGRSVRRRCFATDGERLVMPAIGAFTGGLNVRDAAFGRVFPGGLMAFALGTGRVFALSEKQLIADEQRAAAWRL